MWWSIGAVVETELAVIAFLFNLRVILGSEFCKITLILINPVKERIEGRAQVKASSTAVADIKDPTRLGFELRPGPAGSDEVKFWHNWSL